MSICLRRIGIIKMLVFETTTTTTKGWTVEASKRRRDAASLSRNFPLRIIMDFPIIRIDYISELIEEKEEEEDNQQDDVEHSDAAEKELIKREKERARDD